MDREKISWTVCGMAFLLVSGIVYNGILHSTQAEQREREEIVCYFEDRGINHLFDSDEGGAIKIYAIRNKDGVSWIRCGF